MSHFSRRDFLKHSATTSALVAGAGLLTSASSYARVIGANDRVRIGLAGAGARGGEHVGFIKKVPNVDIVALADPESLKLGTMAARIEKEYSLKPVTYGDYRKMLENKDVDAVSITSCNHWHALMGIWAIQAGKDAFVEKPCCYNVFEGLQLLAAVNKYKQIVQHGTQRRSEAKWRKLVAAVHSGKYGKLIGAKVYVRRQRNSLGFKPITDPPATLDWDQWIGPAEMQPYHANLQPYNWHWFWNTGNGEIGNNGVHHFDIVRWALKAKHPKSAISFGLNIIPDPLNNNKDQRETPTVQFVLYDFDGIPVIYEACNLAGPKESWTRLEEAAFHTDRGLLRADPGRGTGVKFYADGKGKGEEVDVAFEEPSCWIIENFVNCVRDRDASKLCAPISEGFPSTSVCHWGNLSYRSGGEAPLAKAREAVGNTSFMQNAIDEVYANLKNVLKDVDVEKLPVMLGSKILVDGEKGQSLDNPKANLFLKRQKPRAGFVVPEEV